MANELAKKNGGEPKFIKVGIFDYYHQQLRKSKNRKERFTIK